MTNCIVFALRLYWRRKGKGRDRYFLVRQSRHGWFPHVLYAERRKTGTYRIVSYVPDNPNHKRIPPPYFKGHPKWGDFS